MSFTLIAGPPGSGKTIRLIGEVRAAAQRGERVWWIGLPAQRSHVLRALTKDEPLLGAEFLTPQQLAYRLLADARRLRPLLTGTGRLATVGEALLADRDDPPSPGEARLFARAIAEAKRHGLPAGKIPGNDPETARLRRVHRAYERLKGDAWDYDDFRIEAADWLEGHDGGASGDAGQLLPDRLVVDGFRELGPSDLRLFEALGAHRPVRVAVAVPPPGRVPHEKLPPRDDVELNAYRFPNPVAEARWVLRDVKAALAGGAQPLDLALIVPPGRARAIATLADEFGVPLMDETPRGLADRPEGRRLLDLLEMNDQPSASRLLGIPELRGLGVAALDAGVAGRDAVARLAEARGEGDLWRGWLARLEPTDDVLAWGAALVDAALDAAAGPTGGAATEPDEEAGRFREQALQRLAEARRVADGPRIREWWAALLQETTVFARPAAGVALLHAVQASGRRFRRAWIVGATEGAHVTREREDYFVPEEARSSWEAAFERPLLPRRFLARQGAETAELRARGDVTIVTVPEGDQAGPVLADPRLVGEAPSPAPGLPAGSVLDLGGGRPYDPPEGPVDLGPPDVQGLARYAQCGFRHWAERRLREDDDAPWWAELRRVLRSRRSWDPDELRQLGDAVPEAAAWLDLHADELATFTFGVELAEPDGGPRAVLDAARRQNGVATLTRFVAPDAAHGPDDVERILDARSTEYWAAAHLLERHRREVRSVRFRVWPILGAPLDFPERGPVANMWGRFQRVRREVDAALPAWRAGAVRPSPGYVCRDCAAFDLCRDGRR